VRATSEIVSLRSQTELTTARRCRQVNETSQTREIDVLKITRTETPAEETWILQGRLVGLWVSELRRTWKKTHRTDNTMKCVVDLNEVTFIDKQGENLLRAMSKQGAQFIATGIYIKHVLQQRCTR
jgi:anti-anti-sigma regulatory factor